MIKIFTLSFVNTKSLRPIHFRQFQKENYLLRGIDQNFVYQLSNAPIIKPTFKMYIIFSNLFSLCIFIKKIYFHKT